MNCPSCGKSIPDDSAFCLHCGNAISNKLQESPLWEYKDFVWTYKEQRQQVGIVYSASAIARQTWDFDQANILPNIKKWMDDGWEPISEIGPSAYKILEFPPTFSQRFFGSMSRDVVVKEFRVKMRRKKRDTTSQSNVLK